MKSKDLGRTTGYSAYEIWLQQGNTGTEQDFLNSLKAQAQIDERIEEIVEDYLDEHPISGGATAEEVEQIHTNTDNIETLLEMFPDAEINHFDWEKIKYLSGATNNNNGSFLISVSDSSTSAYATAYIEATSTQIRGQQPLEAGNVYISFKAKGTQNIFPTKELVNSASFCYYDSNNQFQKVTATKVLNNILTSEEQIYQISVNLPNNTAGYGFSLQMRSVAGMQVLLKDFMVSYSQNTEYYPAGYRKIDEDKVGAIELRTRMSDLENSVNNVTRGLKTNPNNLWDINKLRVTTQCSVENGIITTSPLSNYGAIYLDARYDSTARKVITYNSRHSIDAGDIYVSFKHRLKEGTPSKNGIFGNISIVYKNENDEDKSISLTPSPNFMVSDKYQFIQCYGVLPENATAYGFNMQLTGTGDTVYEIKDLMVSHNDNRFFTPADSLINDNENFTIELPKDIEEAIIPPWENKKILYLGDSITANNGWVNQVNKRLNVRDYTKVAVHGATWEDKNNTILDGNPVLDGEDGNANNTISNQVQKIINGINNDEDAYKGIDTIIIAAGTNDWIYVRQTDLEDMFEQFYDSNSDPISIASVDRKTMGGAMRYAYEKLRELYPNADIFYCTPIQANEKVRTYSKITLIRKCIMQFCEMISDVTCIDTFNCGICGLYENQNAVGKYLQDGLHPEAYTGGLIQGDYNAKALMEYYKWRT